jgi:hypothetical protein
MSPTAELAEEPTPESGRSPRALRVLHDPIEWVWSLYRDRRREFEQLNWTLADVYLELGGGPRGSELHGRFRDFFNGQTRRILATSRAEQELEHWAGIPERGAALRDEALEILVREDDVEADGARSGHRPDPQTRSLILAHNQIDAELHAHFRGATERGRPWRDAPRTSTAAAICVLGMSRSGTSVTARVLNVLGVELGREEELMEPASGNNPAGFWEHERIADLNEDILATLGDAPRQRWRRPPLLPEGWERDPRLEPHRREARSMLQESFAGLPLWGWKDPRTCLTLPFWRRVLEEIRHVESRLRYVICVRHPLDVAASLEARDGLGREEAVRLWGRYMSEAIVQTSGCPRAFVSYEGYFPDWEGQVGRLAELLGRSRLTESRRAAIAAHIDESLWHHREAGRARGTGWELPAEIAGLHARLAARCGPDPQPADEADLDDAARRAAQPPAQA